MRLLLLRSLSSSFSSSAALCLVTNVAAAAAAVTNVGRLPNAAHEIAFSSFLLPPRPKKQPTHSLLVIVRVVSQ